MKSENNKLKKCAVDILKNNVRFLLILAKCIILSNAAVCTQIGALNLCSDSSEPHGYSKMVTTSHRCTKLKTNYNKMNE